MFNLDRFVEDCRRVAGESDDHSSVREIVAREMADANAATAGPGEAPTPGSSPRSRRRFNRQIRIVGKPS